MGKIISHFIATALLVGALTLPAATALPYLDSGEGNEPSCFAIVHGSVSRAETYFSPHMDMSYLGATVLLADNGSGYGATAMVYPFNCVNKVVPLGGSAGGEEDNDEEPQESSDPLPLLP